MNRTEYLKALEKRQQIEEEMKRIEEELHSATHGEVQSGQGWKLDGDAVEIEGERVYVYISLDDLGSILNALALENYDEVVELISPFDEASPPTPSTTPIVEKVEVEEEPPMMKEEPPTTSMTTVATEEEIAQFVSNVMDVRLNTKGQMPLLFLHGPRTHNPTPKRVPGTVLEITSERSEEEILRHIKDVMKLSEEPYLRTGLTLVGRKKKSGKLMKTEKTLMSLVLWKEATPS